nr:hypothetical protein BdHM001_35440 [Bdellovibrio sp. HM001]
MEILLGLIFCTVGVIVGIVRFFSNRAKEKKNAESLRVAGAGLDSEHLDEFLENLENGGRPKKYPPAQSNKGRRTGYGGKI